MEVYKKQQQAKNALIELEQRLLSLDKVVEQADKYREDIEKAKNSSNRSDEKFYEKFLKNQEKLAIQQNNYNADQQLFCPVCGASVNCKNYTSHIETCYRRQERELSYETIFPCKVRMTHQLFCDEFDKQTKRYCKRLWVCCPEHTKKPKMSEKELCGFPIDDSEHFLAEIQENDENSENLEAFVKKESVPTKNNIFRDSPADMLLPTSPNPMKSEDPEKNSNFIKTEAENQENSSPNPSVIARDDSTKLAHVTDKKENYTTTHSLSSNVDSEVKDLFSTEKATTPKAGKNVDVKQLENSIFHANRWDPVTINEQFKRSRLDLMHEVENTETPMENKEKTGKIFESENKQVWNTGNLKNDVSEDKLMDISEDESENFENDENLAFLNELPPSPENNTESENNHVNEWIDRFGHLKYCQLSKKACFRHFNWETTLRAAIDIQRVRWYNKIEELESKEYRLRIQESQRYNMFNILTHKIVRHGDMNKTEIGSKID